MNARISTKERFTPFCHDTLQQPRSTPHPTQRTATCGAVFATKLRRFVRRQKIDTLFNKLQTIVLLHVDVKILYNWHIMPATLAPLPCTKYSTMRRDFCDEMKVFCREPKNRHLALTPLRVFKGPCGCLCGCSNGSLASLACCRVALCWFSFSSNTYRTISLTSLAILHLVLRTPWGAGES